ncbi:hypothetical protein CHS0354_005032 [Potamilus streckersoni]|uniref:Uncharacterized protein n=1 Tax=Potamilus streckersoni TaxID=2493646 RepID=A0AAE0W1R9_9BIVA|nr:hypothetical protein CHS0354_005032 [Potamilus streckersoni]
MDSNSALRSHRHKNVPRVKVEELLSSTLLAKIGRSTSFHITIQWTKIYVFLRRYPWVADLIRSTPISKDQRAAAFYITIKSIKDLLRSTSLADGHNSTLFDVTSKGLLSSTSLSKYHRYNSFNITYPSVEDIVRSTSVSRCRRSTSMLCDTWIPRMPLNMQWFSSTFKIAKFLFSVCVTDCSCMLGVDAKILIVIL